MPQSSFALMTNLGRAKEAAALANGTTIQITQIAIGDGVTVPSGGETALYHEVARKTISAHGTVVGASNVAYFDCYLAAGDGPYTIYEAGLYDFAGDLIAIAHYDPPINKPVPSSGQTVEGTVRLEVAFSNVATVLISVDPSMQVALQRLTRLPWIPIIELYRNAPPVSPAPGDTYVIGSAPSGTWVGNSGNVAEYTLAGWAMIAPPAGHGVSLPDGRIYERIGGAYIEKIAIDVQSGKWNWSLSTTGTGNAIVATIAVPPPAYVAGMGVVAKIALTNTGAATINVNGLGPQAIVRFDGTPVQARDLLAGMIAELRYDGVAFQLLTPSTALTRIMANQTLYVRPDGSDANDGSANTAAAAFQTIAAAISFGLGRFAFAGFSLNIKLGVPGTYAPPWSVVSATTINIVGDETGAGQANYIIGGAARPGGGVISAEGTATINLSGVTLYNSTMVGHTAVATAGRLNLTNVTFTQGATSTIYTAMIGIGGVIGVNAGCIVSGGTYARIWQATYTGGAIFINGNVSFVGTPTATIIAHALDLGGIFVVQGAISGAATGTRWIVSYNSVIDTNGAGENYFPGTGAGVKGVGGTYV